MQSSSQPGRKSRRWLYASALTFVACLAISLSPRVTAVQARGTGSASCFGSLQATPNPVRIGHYLQLRGAGFTCKSAKGRPLKIAAVFLYQPNKAFFIYSVHIRTDGTYSARVFIPRQLIAAASIYSGHQKRVNTRPGTYYLGIRVASVALPLVSQALATIHVDA